MSVNERSLVSLFAVDLTEDVVVRDVDRLGTVVFAQCHVSSKAMICE